MGQQLDESLLLRTALAERLEREGYFLVPSLMEAFSTVPRHLFLPEVPLERVYQDDAISTKTQQGRVLSSSSRPALMAQMLAQLDPQPGDRVLEIGTGTGYNAALLAHLVGPRGHVHSVEIDDDLASTAREHLAAYGVENVTVIAGDGGEGFADAAPYDRILLTVGAWDITPAWAGQLRPEGRLVLPLSVHGPQRSIGFENRPGHLASVSVADCGFIRIRGASAGIEKRLRLAPDIPLFLGYEDERSVDPDAVHGLLTGPSRVLATGLRVTYRDLWSGLVLWLALREPVFCGLSAQGPFADAGLVPYLFGLAGRFCDTAGILEEDGMCMLMRPPDRPLPAQEPPEDEAFELFVRCYGTDDALAERMLAQLRAWDEGGRPGTAELQVRAYPRPSSHTPAPGEYVLRKRWTDLVCSWKGTRNEVTE